MESNRRIMERNRGEWRVMEGNGIEWGETGGNREE